MQLLQPFSIEPYRAHLRLEFKYRLVVRKIMLAQQKTLIILAVLLLAPISGAVGSQSNDEQNIRSSAASNWHSIEPSQTTTTALKSLDYLIHLALASFDPLNDELPESRLDDSQDYRSTGMAIVQLKHHTGCLLYTSPSPRD